MILSRVVGDVVAPQSHATHDAIKLLLVQPVDSRGSDLGRPMVAVDALDAGVGDTVLVTLDGWAAGSVVERERAPIDAAVIAVVDAVEWDPDLSPGE